MRISQWLTLTIIMSESVGDVMQYVPKVRGQVDTEYSTEAEVVDGYTKSQSPDDNTDIRDDNLAKVVRSKDDRSRLEVYIAR